MRKKWWCECPKSNAQNETFKWILAHDHQNHGQKHKTFMLFIDTSLLWKFLLFY